MVKEDHLEGLSTAGLIVLDLVLRFAAFGLLDDVFCTFRNSYCLTLHPIPFQQKVSDVVDPVISPKRCTI